MYFWFVSISSLPLIITINHYSTLFSLGKEYFFLHYTHEKCIIKLYRVYKVGKSCFFEREREGAMKKRINITLDDDVIERVDSYARQHYTSRSGAITMLIVDATEINTKKKEEQE